MIDSSLLKIKGIKRICFILLILSILQVVLIIAQAISLASTITNLFNGEKLGTQLFPILLFFVFYVSKHFIKLMNNRLMSRFATNSGKDLRKQLMNKSFELGPNITATEGTGNLITKTLEGISQVENYLKLFLPKFFNILVIPVGIFLYTLTIDMRSAIILLLVLPVLMFFLIFLGKLAKLRANKQYEVYKTLSNHFVDSLRGLETLRLLGLSKNYDRNIELVSEKYRKSTMGTLTIAFLSNFSLQFFTSLSIAIVALFLGLGLIDGDIALYPSLVILILAPEYFQPIREIGLDYHATLDGKNVLSEIHEIINVEGMETDDKFIPSWNEQSMIALKDITIQHKDTNIPSLQSVSISWKGFGKIGIIGASGSGKSTLIQTLSGIFQPDSGTIEINGEKIDSFRNGNWLKQLYYIPQKPYVFNDTLRNNVSFYTPDATDEKIKKACELAGLSYLIDSLPKGLYEVIGESGRSLSGGQEQRVALARAFLDESRKILLLDEPTAHLDIETEYEIKQSILPLLENKLVFFATHRLHWCLEMDWIVVLHHGNLVEMGTHDELLKKKGAYYEFVKAQLSKENDDD